MLALAISILAVAAFPVADDAITGKVTVVDRTYAFPAGKIDWKRDPWVGKLAFNREWIFQLNRMYFWTPMAEAYTATGDEKYAKAFAAQLESWLDQTGGGIPPEEGYRNTGSVFRTLEEGLRLSGSWRAAWKAFADSPAFTPELKSRFLASARAQAKHLMRHYTDRNWLLMEMEGVYSFATLFPSFPESAEYRRESVRIFFKALRNQVLPDGMQYEHSPDYHYCSVKCAVRIFELARESGYEVELPEDAKQLLASMADATIALAAPGLVQPRFNDCYTVPTKSIVGMVAPYVPKREDFRWVMTDRAEGAPPAGVTASRYLPYCGYAAMRTDWSKDATYLAFDVGPVGMGHKHQDKLSFTLWKGDEELVFDDGGGHYESSPYRRYGVSGYDHCTLLVDGLAQFRDGRECSRVPIEAGWTTTADRDSAFGIYDEGFGEKGARLATQRREIVFDKRADEFVITDRVQSADGAPHDYTLLFQLKTTKVTIAADGKSLVADYGEGRRWGLKMTFEGIESLTSACGRKEPTLAGWFIGRVHEQVCPATTVFAACKAAKDRVFVTRLKPFESKTNP